MSGARWTTEEINILKEYYPQEGIQIIRRFSNRTIRAVFMKAYHSGINCRNPSNKWTLEELNIIIEYYPQEGSDIAARLPGRTVEAIYTAACALGINKYNMCG